MPDPALPGAARPADDGGGFIERRGCQPPKKEHP
jgi:hypothetical protein